MEFLQENKGANVCKLSFSKDFFIYDTKAWYIKENAWETELHLKFKFKTILFQIPHQ